MGPEPGLLHRRVIAFGDAVAVLVPRYGLVGLAGLEIGGGRVEEKQVYFKVQQVGDLEVRSLCHLRLDGQQVVHRPVAGLLVDLVQAVDVRIVRDPPRRGELGGRCKGPVGDQREQYPLDPGIELAAGQLAADHLVQAQLAPQLVQDVGAADRARGRQRQLAARRRGDRAGRVQQPGQRRDQALDAVAVDLVLAAEGMQDLGARDPGLSVPFVVGQLQVPDDLPVLGLARRRLQVHDVEASRSPTSRSNYLPRSTQCNYLTRVTRLFYSSPLVATR